MSQKWLVVLSSSHPSNYEERTYYYVFDSRDFADVWMTKHLDYGESYHIEEIDHVTEE